MRTAVTEIDYQGVREKKERQTDTENDNNRQSDADRHIQKTIIEKNNNNIRSYMSTSS